MIKFSNLFFQILDGVADFSQLLQTKNKQSNNSVCSYWVDVSPVSRDEFQMFSKFWENEIFTDITLLVGADQVPIKVHRIILAAHFEYFNSMFSTGLKESTSREVSLPFIGLEDLRLLLKYAYNGKANLTKENVFQMTIIANYFGCKNLMDKCCDFLKTFTNVQNCVKLLEVSDRLHLDQVRANCFAFVVDHLPKVDKDDLSELPVELILEIMGHPAARIDSCDPVQSEKKLFHLIWKKIESTSEESQIKYIPKVLKAIHLPVTDKDFLFFLLKLFAHIPEARELIIQADENVDDDEIREWYRKRFVGVVLFRTGGPLKPIEVNGILSSEYSPCVLIKGFPFFICVTPSNQKEKEYHVESPVAIEHLGLPYKVIVEMQNGQLQWVPVNTYHNGVVDKRPIDGSYKNEKGWFGVRVKLQ